MMLCPYIILDAQHQSADEMIRFVELLSGMNIKIYQLRMKLASQVEIKRMATLLLPLIHLQGAILLLNDHVKLILELGVDGVHIGQGDMTIQVARYQQRLQGIWHKVMP